MAPAPGADPRCCGRACCHRLSRVSGCLWQAAPCCFPGVRPGRRGLCPPPQTSPSAQQSHRERAWTMVAQSRPRRHHGRSQRLIEELGGRRAGVGGQTSGPTGAGQQESAHHSAVRARGPRPRPCPHWAGQSDSSGVPELAVRAKSQMFCQHAQVLIQVGVPPTPGREKLAQAPLELETFVTISLSVLVNVPRT